LQTYWNIKGFITHRVPDSADLKKLAASSSPKDWERRAWSMFHQQHYSEAIFAFERAENPQQSAVARAYHLHEEAMSTTDTISAEQKRKRHICAAEAFRQCAESTILKGDKDKFVSLAGDLYSEAGEFKKAAEIYMQAYMFREAVSCMYRGKMFDEALSVIQDHPQEDPGEIADKVLFAARMSHLKRNDLRY
jgi:tetratricopeptide (TPR) repeat protein